MRNTMRTLTPPSSLSALPFISLSLLRSPSSPTSHAALSNNTCATACGYETMRRMCCWQPITLMRSLLWTAYRCQRSHFQTLGLCHAFPGDDSWEAPAGPPSRGRRTWQRDTSTATTAVDANTTRGQTEEAAADSWEWRKSSFSCRRNWPNDRCTIWGNEFASGKVRADSTQTGSWTESLVDYLHTYYSMMTVQLHAGGGELSH